MAAGLRGAERAPESGWEATTEWRGEKAAGPAVAAVDTVQRIKTRLGGQVHRVSEGLCMKTGLGAGGKVGNVLGVPFSEPPDPALLHMGSQDS